MSYPDDSDGFSGHFSTTMSYPDSDGFSGHFSTTMSYPADSDGFSGHFSTTMSYPDSDGLSGHFPISRMSIKYQEANMCDVVVIFIFNIQITSFVKCGSLSENGFLMSQMVSTSDDDGRFAHRCRTSLQRLPLTCTHTAHGCLKNPEAKTIRRPCVVGTTQPKQMFQE
jgi:hypothetical protein